jgi:hypothetical protein
MTNRSILACAVVLTALGCTDADARLCAEASTEANWQACNRSCTDNNTKESCDRSKTLAVEVCTESNSVNACRAACLDGDEPACERVNGLAVKEEAAKPRPDIK